MAGGNLSNPISAEIAIVCPNMAKTVDAELVLKTFVYHGGKFGVEGDIPCACGATHEFSTITDLAHGGENKFYFENVPDREPLQILGGSLYCHDYHKTIETWKRHVRGEV